jgi:hypothetical protein
VTTVGRVGKDEGIRIGRPSVFGNPFKIGRDGDRGQVIEKYRRYFSDRVAKDEAFRVAVEGLKGKKLLCYCHPRACHGDVIAEYLNGRG